jgi:hypothetical protein
MGKENLKLTEIGARGKGPGARDQDSTPVKFAALVFFEKFNPGTIFWSYGAGGVKVQPQ